MVKSGLGVLGNVVLDFKCLGYGCIEFRYTGNRCIGCWVPSAWSSLV